MKKVFEGILTYSIYILVFLLPLFFLPFTGELYEFNKLFLLFFITLIGFLAWAGKLILVERAVIFKRTPFDLWVLLFWGFIGIGTIFSQDWRNSVFGAYGRFSGNFIELTLWVLFYILITQNFTARQAKRLIELFLISSSLVAISFHLAFWGALQYLHLPFQFISTLGISPQGLAVFLGIALATLVSYWIFAHPQRTSMRILYGAAFLVQGGVLVIVNSPWTWIVIGISAFGLLSIVLLLHLLTGKEINRLSLCIFFILVALLFFFFPSLFHLANVPSEILLNNKTSWQISVEAFRQSPLVGVGLGNWQESFLRFKPLLFNASSFWQYRFDTPLSYYALLLSTAGMLGIIAYLILMGMLGFLLRKVFREDHSPRLKIVILPALFGLAALLVSFIWYYETITLSLLFWTFLAVLGIFFAKGFSLAEFRRDFKITPEANLFLSSLFLLIIVGVGLVGFFGGKFYYAELLYKKSLAAPSLKEQVDVLTRVISLSPFEVEYRLALSQAASLYTQGELEKLPPAASGNDQETQKILPYVNLAINQIEYLAKSVPRRLAVWEVRGALYKNFRKFSGKEAVNLAIDSFKKAGELAPTDPIYPLQIARIALDENDIPQAKSETAKAQSLKPDYPRVAFMQALIKDKEKQGKDGIALLEHALGGANLTPDMLQEGYFYLGIVAYNSGEYKKAIHAFDAVLQTNPNHIDALFGIALAYEKQGNKTKALGYYTKLLELTPHNPEIQKRIDALGE